ncbi:MAG TPA: GGDEF domain-containing protein [Ruminococcus flavefaciens]|nr:GGDEF domain-containing protein [Ruminococcus flavefaciens]
MKGYRIALIIEEIDQSYQSAVLSGISVSAAEFGLNISAFISFSGSVSNPRHDAGEFNIFNLPDFHDFDGAILLTNTIGYEPLANSIHQRIREAGIPAVSIDNDIEDFYYIGIDNKTAMREITEHMINKHGLTSFNYISGPKDNPESADRLKAFLEVLDEHNIMISEDRIYYGDFRAPSGKKAVEYFINSGGTMPQAIICANDVMAASAINRLSAEGYNVPEDIAVTGFDNTYATHNYQVELTSVDRPLALSGRIACKTLYNHFNKIPVPHSNVLSMSTRFTESCGCFQNAVTDIAHFKELNYRNYTRFETAQNHMAKLNNLSSELLGCNNFEEYIDKLKDFCRLTNPDEYYLCLCENWNEGGLRDYTYAGMIDNTKVPTNYTKRMLVPIAYVDGQFYNVGSIKKKHIIPNIADTLSTGRFYYIIPLHFAERCLGYMVISNSRIPLNNSTFETFCICLSNSLENIRKLICLEYAVNRLGSLYVHDTFSGIYNRNGFVQAASGPYKRCIREQKSIMLMFIDLDGLKMINDTYGHDVGDTAICYIADVLSRSCRKNEIFCRFGGDEFIVFAPEYSVANAEALVNKIKDNIIRINNTGSNPFELSASIGYIIEVPEENDEIFDFVTKADKVMYEEKKKKKHSHYLKS